MREYRKNHSDTVEGTIEGLMVCRFKVLPDVTVVVMRRIIYERTESWELICTIETSQERFTNGPLLITSWGIFQNRPMINNFINESAYRSQEIR